MSKATNIKAIAELAKGMKARKAREEAERRARRNGKPEPANDPLAGSVNEFAAKQGDYDRHNGRTVNRSASPVIRWKNDGLLSDSQEAAILHCQRLWRLTDCSGRLVANLDRTVFGCPGDGNIAEIEARDDLHRIKNGFPAGYWSVFEAVCRFDEPAGVAGSRLAKDDVTRRTMARAVVLMVADMITMRERLSY